MTPEEKTLIEGVFNRLAQSGVGTKDADADGLIRAYAQRIPDAAYGLVQAVIVLEAGLAHAQGQIAELNAKLAAATPAHGGPGSGFLPNSGPWSAPPPAGYAAPAYPTNPAPVPPPAGNPWAQTTSPVGGFLRNAATMAAGVAGGTLIAEGLSNLFGGHGYGGGFGGGGFGGGGFGGGGPWGSGGGNVIENVTVNNVYEGSTPPASDPGYQDAAYQGGGDDGWSDTGGGFDDGGSGDDGSI